VSLTVALRRGLVSLSHRIDSFRELRARAFVNATGVNPEVFQVVLSDLFSTEPDLLIARLLLASAISQVFESDLRSIRSPCVRKYCVGRDCMVANEVLAKAELARFAASQKSHCFAWSFTAGRSGEETGVRQVACGPGISYLPIERVDFRAGGSILPSFVWRPFLSSASLDS